MTFKNHPWRILLCGLAVLCLTYGIKFAANPLRRSNNGIHSWLLKKIPRGSSESHFLTIAKAEGWEVSENGWHGPVMDIKGWGGFDPDTPLYGHTYYHAHLGHYFSGLRVDISTIWAFDDKGNFVDVRIRREIDGP